VQQFLAEENIPVINQQQYSLDLRPSDFRLFSALKMTLNGGMFCNRGGIKLNSTAKLQNIPK
jgi:hypothetical protein